MEFGLLKVTTFVLSLQPQAARPTYSLNNKLKVDISDICINHLSCNHNYPTFLQLQSSFSERNDFNETYVYGMYFHALFKMLL